MLAADSIGPLGIEPESKALFAPLPPNSFLLNLLSATALGLTSLSERMSEWHPGPRRVQSRAVVFGAPTAPPCVGAMPDSPRPLYRLAALTSGRSMSLPKNPPTLAA